MPSKYPNKTRTLPNSASNPFEEQLHGWLGCNWSFKSMFTGVLILSTGLYIAIMDSFRPIGQDSN
jgi:hypothetical protein